MNVECPIKRPSPRTTPKSTSMGPSEVSHSSMTCKRNEQITQSLNPWSKDVQSTKRFNICKFPATYINCFLHLRQISLIVAVSCLDSIGLHSTQVSHHFCGLQGPLQEQQSQGCRLSPQADSGVATSESRNRLLIGTSLSTCSNDFLFLDFLKAARRNQNP